MGKAILFAAMLALLIADLVAFSHICHVTPPPNRAGIIIGSMFQLCALGAIAVALQYFRFAYQPFRPAAVSIRIRVLVSAVVFCAISTGLFRSSLLFSDTLWQRGAVSVGCACFE